MNNDSIKHTVFFSILEQHNKQVISRHTAQNSEYTEEQCMTTTAVG